MTVAVNVSEIIEQVSQSWQHIRKDLTLEAVLDRTISVQQIPAPTFAEQERAEWVEHAFQKIGLTNVERDNIHNVIGWLNPPQDNTNPIILVSAHLDTVFPADTDLSLERRGNRVYAPGIGDNSLGVGAVLLLAEVLTEHLKTSKNISLGFIANSREEGLGDLDGIRTVVDGLPHERIQGAIILEGMALGAVYNTGIAVRRLKIKATAEGGHSWLHFGKPSAVHTLTKLCADITDIEVPLQPRTTYNIGEMRGGHSINSIATEAECLLDMRSSNLETLEQLQRTVQALIDKYQSDAVPLTVEIIGDRPPGNLSADHPLIRMAIKAYQQIGLKPSLEQGSTDANYLLSRNIPATVVGISYGGNAHRLDEFIETEPIADGMWSLLLLVVGMVKFLS